MNAGTNIIPHPLESGIQSFTKIGNIHIKIISINPKIASTFFIVKI